MHLLVLTALFAVVGIASGSTEARASMRGAEAVVAVEGLATLDQADGKAFVLRLSAPPGHLKTGFLAPDAASGVAPRWYVDIDGARLSAALSPRVFEGGSVRGIRFGQHTRSTARVVLDLAHSVKAENVTVSPHKEGLLIRVEETKDTIAGLISAQSRAETPLPEPSPTPLPRLLRHRVVLDAGHGGEDTGAIGPGGTLEKDVCLAVVKLLADRLGKRDKYDVFLTRTDDRFLSLLERTEMANRWEGDIFVSVHANASPRRSARGVSTYFLDNTDDKESLRVAMRENGVLDPSTWTVNPARSESYYLEVMKASMVKNFHTVQSTSLARAVQENMVGRLSKNYKDIHDYGVRYAGFYVLTGAAMPAVLVETSFISNPVEERRLRDRRYQAALAEAVAIGIEKYFAGRESRGDHAALFGP